jgi:elongation factor Ts
MDPMAEITAAMVKDLREKTSAGMMDCKKALSATEGDLEAAVNWLREKGLSAAAKKAGRVAAEGLVDIAQVGGVTSIVEVNCETDFVSKNPDFKAFVADLAKAIAQGNPSDLDAVNALALDGKTVKDVLTEKIAKIGENMSIRRFARVESQGVGIYIHGGGSLGIVVELSAADGSKLGNPAVAALAKDVAMHASFSNPLFIRREQADQKVIEAERTVYKEKARADGKPEAIIEKIAEGQVQKFLKESCLLEQPFVKDEDTTVGKLIDKVGAELGTKLDIKSVHRFKVGEGIEKKADDFMAEVAKMAGTAHA